MKMSGITLIELLISIAITVVIAGTVYFSLNAALESWGCSKDRLALQKVLNDVTEDITNGIGGNFGLRDVLEITAADKTRVEFVPPWTDESHTVRGKDFVYTLEHRLKPGTAPPITEVKFPEASQYIMAMSVFIDQKESATTQLILPQTMPEGSQLRFIYHPDPEAGVEVIKTIRWDEEEGQLYTEYLGETEGITKNPFGVKISDFRLRFFDNQNSLITESDYIDNEDLIRITGVEVMVTAKLGGTELSLLSFVTLRNAPMKSGYIPLKKGLKIPIPDSTKIHSLLLTNIFGVDNEDALEFEAEPERGKSWLLKIVFSRLGTSQPKIDRYTIEYPPGQEVYNASIGLDTRAGLNMRLLDPGGLFDYDDDVDIDDVVLLNGNVTLEVKEMDIKGAGLFIRP